MARLSVDQEAVAMMVSAPLHTAVGRDFSGAEELARAVQLSFRLLAFVANYPTWIAAVGECDTRRHTVSPLQK